jgi:ATP-dependent helicase HrpB
VKRSDLPIDAALPALVAALRTNAAVVLEAPPGAGKSTVVPLALLEESWMQGRRLIMLEPRRLAARAVAQRMAQTLGEQVGRTVGYRMRLDTRVSGETRIEVVTEGVLTRMLQEDPALEGTAAVVFDEFHERNLQADLGLTLALDAQANVAPELKILLMSATIDVESIAHWLGDAPVIRAEGRVFPVETRFAARGAPVLPQDQTGYRDSESPERLTAQVVRRALAEEQGDVLVFLPGAAEIRRVQALLEGGLGESTRVFPLYGDLSQAAQDEALAPNPGGERRIVLATNIAETSLTIAGIRIVVDSGLVRRSVFDPVTGMASLVTRRISRASAEQRQGRAGRVGPGVCYRLWSEGAQRSLAPFSPPEILEADLAPLALELAVWGVRDAGELRWLDVPPEAMLAGARELLQRLGALDEQGRVTPHGRELVGLALHPRLGHMLLKARALELIGSAAQLAALLTERDLRPASTGVRDADIRTRLELLRSSETARAAGPVAERVRRSARDIARRAGGAERLQHEPEDMAQAGLLLAFAYPDRIALRRAGAEGRYVLANGRGAFFAEAQSLARQELLVAVDLDDRERDARILLAAPLARADLMSHFAHDLRSNESIEWSEREQAVVARHTVTFGALVLEEKPLRRLPPEAALRAMLDGVRRLGLDVLPWDRDARDLQARIEFVRERVAAVAGESEWPSVGDAALGASLEAWLAPWLDGVTRREHLARVPMAEALKALLSFAQQRELDRLAPTHLAVPSGSRIRIDYLDESAPVVAVRLQEVFGLGETPRVGAGKVPVTFKLLSPAQRPVQITRDLAGFWRGSYAEVRKDLRGRYPKHYWPENPLEAEPTRRAKPRR